ncbi:HlyD family secretion protein [Actinomadura decatromicini]|uniref:HlyD family efflux transporter periplasmic adaptor subunit n=1 Tax=Actinomadura decatromicini TaxID=2604572 RepID=A0A5D3FZ87_9ACTN|nr:HlyD family efflux transporter periplasmic adaptor subunit [Actinomadura decatromicini]TYK53040.1 HlyD family efflux transporter periplasmic adaptor subunit [Actinomadura decatromicini]
MSPLALARRFRRVPTLIWPAFTLLIVIGVLLVWAGGGGKASPASSRGPVSAPAPDGVAAAGTVRSADTRDLAFGTAGKVVALGVRVGNKVRAGRVLARLDDTQAKERLQVAEAALDAAVESRDAPQQQPSGSPGGSAGCTAAAAAYGMPTRTPVTTSPTPTPTPSAPRSRTPSSQPSPAPAPTTTRRAPSGGCGAQGQPSPSSSGQNGSSGRQSQAEAQVIRAETELREAQRALAGTRITAPIDGTVLTVAGTTGTQVSGAGSAGFITLGDLTELQVEGMFSQSDVARLKVGQDASITLPVRPGAKYTGSVVHIDPSATTDGDLVRYGVKIAFDDAPDGLLIGMNATVTVAP